MTDMVQHDARSASRSMDASSLRSYVQRSGWVLSDQDERTSLWLAPAGSPQADVQVVLPERETFSDSDDLVERAVRALSWAQQRPLEEVVRDVSTGGADSLSVRLFPTTPSGQAPLETAHTALSSLRELVIGSAAGVEAGEGALVVPSRRSTRAEAYAGQTMVSTRSGSFVIDVSFPLQESGIDEPPASTETTPFGRQVTTRLVTVARRAASLATSVGAGDTGIDRFGAEGTADGNATELNALARLGQASENGDRGRYQLRFAQSPLWTLSALPRPELLTITPAQQSVLSDAAEYLRERRPRAGVSIEGLVVRLARERVTGAGDVVVEGVDDDTGSTRRYAVNLSETDYDDAVRAHGQGYRVVVVGDLGVRGTRRHLRNITSFDVLARRGED